MNQARKKTTPALRFNALTPLYDHVVHYTTRERLFKDMLLDAACIKRGESVLDVGCGTGTLMLAIARKEPTARITGVDADAAILRLASRKLDAAAAHSDLALGNSTDMKFEDCTFDHVVSTLFFHHLLLADKKKSVEEMWRVLRPGGVVHIVDWGTPTGVLQRLAFYQIQLLDGFASTRDHVTDKLLALFRQAGFGEAMEFACLRTMFGTLRFIKAVKPQTGIVD